MMHICYKTKTGWAVALISLDTSRNHSPIFVQLAMKQAMEVTSWLNGGNCPSSVDFQDLENYVA